MSVVAADSIHEIIKTVMINTIFLMTSSRVFDQKLFYSDIGDASPFSDTYKLPFFNIPQLKKNEQSFYMKLKLTVNTVKHPS